jgi:hypothetical protein
MSSTRGNYLKKLLNFNREIPLTTSEMKKVGISSFLACKYKNSGWLESIGVGAFKFPNSDLSVEGLLHSLQVDLSLKAHLGAKSSLDMVGVRQFYRRNKKFYLFIETSNKLPKWVMNYKWNGFIKPIRTLRLSESEFLYNPEIKSFDFFISKRELAILEQIDLINKGETFEETAQLFELLPSLNPDLLNILLKSFSVKVKRIFFFLSEYFNHPWINEIDRKYFSVSNTIVSIQKNGKFLKKYNLIIPREFNV